VTLEALLAAASEVPLFALFARKALLRWFATNSNNAKGGTRVVEAPAHLSLTIERCDPEEAARMDACLTSY
jgi:hypothetical protein